MTETQNRPLVSVIIRCFNEEKHIGNLLRALQFQTVKDYEAIIVDSGSNDSTLQIAKSYAARIVTISPKNFTFGFSLNQGCAAARGAIFVIASAHVLPMHERWLEELIKPFTDSKVAIVYGRQIGNSITKFSEHQVFAQQFPETSNFRQQTPFCNNANAAIRREIWEKRNFDETLSGLEDLDMGVWVIKNGYYLAYNADAAIVHIHEETPRKIFNRYKREAIALKKILPDSHLSLWEFLWVWISNMLLDLLRSMKQRTFFRSFAEIMMFRTMQYWGMYSGIHNRSPLTHEMIMRFYYPRRPNALQRNKK